MAASWPFHPYLTGCLVSLSLSLGRWPLSPSSAKEEVQCNDNSTPTSKLQAVSKRNCRENAKFDPLRTCGRTSKKFPLHRYFLLISYVIYFMHKISPTYIFYDHNTRHSNVPTLLVIHIF